MKICMMTNTYLPHVGGVARSVHTFTESFRALGHRAIVVAPTFPDVDEMDPELEKDVVRVPAVQQFNGSDFSVRLPLISMLNPKLVEFEADVIHSHHPFLLGDTALRLGADKNVPVIFTHHTLYEEYVHYVPFTSPTMRQFAIELSTHYSNLCNAVIAPSQSIADLIASRGVEVPITVIPTGIDVEAFANGNGSHFREKHRIPQDAFVVGTLGRLAPEKNLDYLCRAVGKFLGDVPEAHFLVVGSGPSQDKMRAILEELNLSDRLHLVGKKSGKDLYNAYGAMNLFAFSSFSETQGLVLAEAMAAGLPVVALNASGVREVVRHEANGFMLSAKAVEEDFAGKLSELYKNTELRREFGTAARKTAQDFSRERCAARALSLYEETIQKSQPKPADELEEMWNVLRNRLRIEWELLSEKAAAIGAMWSEEETR